MPGRPISDPCLKSSRCQKYGRICRPCPSLRTFDSCRASRRRTINSRIHERNEPTMSTALHPPGSRRGVGRCRLAALAVLALAAAGALGGCADDGNDTALAQAAAADAAAGAAVVEIELGDLWVKPASIDVPAGGSVVLNVTNTGAMPHDLAVGGVGGTGLLQPGASAATARRTVHRIGAGVVHGARAQGGRDGARHRGRRRGDGAGGRRGSGCRRGRRDRRRRRPRARLAGVRSGTRPGPGWHRTRAHVRRRRGGDGGRTRRHPGDVGVQRHVPGSRAARQGGRPVHHHPPQRRGDGPLGRLPRFEGRLERRDAHDPAG